VYARAQRTLQKAITGGTQFMRAHTEIDPRIGLTSFHALKQLARDYAWAVDLHLCVFPQEGLTNDPGAEDLLIEACTQGAGAIGGVPYIDTDPHEQIARIFALARRFNLDVDFHLDFDLDAGWNHIDEVLRQTDAHGWGGRVAVGHMTKFSAMPVADQLAHARRMAGAGVAMTVIPSTDLFLMGRGIEHNVPRGVTRADRFHDQGVTVSLATNNVMNAFTPFGDGSLIRIANLYANIAQLGRPADFETCLSMITTSAARLMNIKEYGLKIGAPADFVVLAADTQANAVAELAQPLAGYKRGIRTFTRAPAVLHPPA
jgi:cytosine/creatinine deaminase